MAALPLWYSLIIDHVSINFIRVHDFVLLHVEYKLSATLLFRHQSLSHACSFFIILYFRYNDSGLVSTLYFLPSLIFSSSIFKLYQRSKHSISASPIDHWTRSNHKDLTIFHSFACSRMSLFFLYGHWKQFSAHDILFSIYAGINTSSSKCFLNKLEKVGAVEGQSMVPALAVHHQLFSKRVWFRLTHISHYCLIEYYCNK